MNSNEGSSKRIITIPNILSVIRILLIVPFVILFARESYLKAVIVIVLSGLSDMFDGLIARAFNQKSDLGLLLDPLADKLTLVSVVVSVTMKLRYVLPVTLILLIKEFIMILGGIYLVRNKIEVPHSKWYGKLATIVFYTTASVLVYLKAVLDYENKVLSVALILITTASMIFALIMYIKLFLNVVEKHTKSEGLKGVK